MPSVDPLDSEKLKGDLGPGYTVGYFGSGFSLGNRLNTFKRIFYIMIFKGQTTVF